jgi:DNA-binding SARP family transcriptional activator
MLQTLALYDQETRYREPAGRMLHVLPTLHIRLLGGFVLRSGDTPITTVDSPRMQALLALLVLQRGAPHLRQHVAFRLWPDSTEAQAHANLRTLLHRLRRALPDAACFLHVDAQTVQWRGDAPCTVDVADFERALAQAAQAEQDGNRHALRTALTEAVESYRDDLLPGWYEDWLLCERERLRQTFLTALEQLILVLECTQEYLAAIGYAQRLLRHEPLHEATYQHLMRLHALRGDRASALRVYQTCATVLARELAVAPSAATCDVYERLQHMGAQQRCIAPDPHPAPAS